MYPWRRILIPTDFSTASQWVFDDAVRMAAGSGAEIVILHVRMTWGSHPNELRLPADAALYEYAERIELEKLRERLQKTNANISTRLIVKVASDAGAEISRAAADETVDLVVMSTHARHHVAHLLIGSTTRQVITKTTVPLLMIRYGIHERRGMRRIVVPVHAKQTSHAAVDLAALIAARENSEIHLLTICGDGDRSAAEGFLAEMKSRVSGAKQEVVLGNDIERDLVRYTEKVDADAIFMNAADAPSQLKLDIIRKAPVPVMIVPV